MNWNESTCLVYVFPCLLVINDHFPRGLREHIYNISVNNKNNTSNLHKALEFISCMYSHLIWDKKLLSVLSSCIFIHFYHYPLLNLSFDFIVPISCHSLWFYYWQVVLEKITKLWALFRFSISLGFWKKVLWPSFILSTISSSFFSCYYNSS